jgi:RHS repeat-associated protein
MLLSMIEAAKEEIPSSFLAWCADPASAACMVNLEKAHQGIAPEKSALLQGQPVCNSTNALGLRGLAALDRVRSRCTGKEHDPESGNDYFGARYYSFSLGRFLTPDWSAAPMAVPYADLNDPQSLNLYGYVRNNPINRTDPNGHWCIFGKIGTTCTPPPPPPPAPKPPAVVTPGTPQYNLANAQGRARENPALQPTGTPGTPGRTTHCNQATCQIARDTGTSTNGLVDRNGNPNLANTDARTLPNSPDWRPATAEEAQQAANQGVVALGVKSADPHGHILTATPEMIPGMQDVGRNGPLVNNIGGSVGISNAYGDRPHVWSSSEGVTWYVPSNWKP